MSRRIKSSAPDKEADPLRVESASLKRKVSQPLSTGKMSSERQISTKKTPKTTSTTFILKDISAVQTVLSAFAFKSSRNGKLLDMDDNGDSIPQTLLSQGEVNEMTDIPVADLLYEKSKRAYYFLDTRKMQNKFWSVMIDVTANGPLPNTIQKPCWWCRHKFSTKPIGCPLKYHSQKSSGIEKERFEEKLKAANLPTTTNDFFETEVYFAAFHVVKHSSSIKKDLSNIKNRLHCFLYYFPFCILQINTPLEFFRSVELKRNPQL